MNAPNLPFLSEENVGLHYEYLSTLKRRLGARIGASNVPRRTNKRTDPHAALRSEIYSHELYFRSFDEAGRRTPVAFLRRSYPSEDSFLFEVIEAAKNQRADFLYLYRLRGRPAFVFGSTPPVGDGVILAVDLCEHAYFCDYGFDKQRYLRAALSYLSLWKLDQND